jgi:hypothetical protein
VSGWLLLARRDELAFFLETAAIMIVRRAPCPIIPEGLARVPAVWRALSLPVPAAELMLTFGTVAQLEFAAALCRRNLIFIWAFVGLAIGAVAVHGSRAGGRRLDTRAAEISGRCGELKRG